MPLDYARLWLEGAALAASAPSLKPPAERPSLAAPEGRRAHRRAGAGVNFWQFRPLEAGEPVERIDWRRSGRSDALLVRAREQLSPGQLRVWVDPSASMRFSGDAARPTKHEVALALVAGLMHAALAVDERVMALAGRGPTAPARAFEQIALEARALRLAACPATATVVLAGDWLDGAPDLPRAPRGLLLRIIDPVEARFPFDEPVALSDPESDGEPRLVEDPAALRSDYLRAWNAHGAAVAAAVARSDWRQVDVMTDRPLAETLARAIGALNGEPVAAPQQAGVEA